MSINQNEIFFRVYNPAVLYPSYYVGCSTNGQANQEKEKKLKGIIELRMPLCCDGCVKKVNKKLKLLEGVASVECSTEKQKVTVRGEAKPDAVLAAAKKILPRSEFWKDEK